MAYYKIFNIFNIYYVMQTQTEVESMCSRVEKVTQENSRLHAELRKSLEARMEAVTQSSYQHRESTGGSISGVSVTRARLEQQLDTVTKDRDNYRDLFKKASQELELLQQGVQVSRHLVRVEGGRQRLLLYWYVVAG